MKFTEFKAVVERAMRGMEEDALFMHPTEGIPFEDWVEELTQELEKRVCGPSS